MSARVAVFKGMTVQLLRMAAVTALIVLITLLPFLPGSYDPLPTPLSS